MNNLSKIKQESEKEWIEITNGNKVVAVDKFWLSKLDLAYEAGVDEGLDLRKAYNDPKLLEKIRQSLLKEIVGKISELKGTRFTAGSDIKGRDYGYDSAIEEIVKLLEDKL